MKKAIRRGEFGRGWVSPNPLVGALVVRNGKIIAAGAHRYFGGAHAEIEALRKAGSRARGATLYITLEPCSTWGKTGPCVNAIIDSGIRRVMIGSLDPNPHHRGRGIRILQKAGILVRAGFLADKVAEQNKGFFAVMKKNRPFVTLKMAQSLDGKIATARGESRWITSEKTRMFVHGLRAKTDAILVGTDTVEKDNPALTARLQKKTNKPARIVLDRTLRLHPNRRVFSEDGAPVYVITDQKQVRRGERKFKSRAIVIGVKASRGKLNLKEALMKLKNYGITSILVEGGGELAASLIAGRLVDRIYWCVAPIFIGGRNAPTSLEGEGLGKLSSVPTVRIKRIFSSGTDTIVEGDL